MLYTLLALLASVLQNLGMKEFSRRFPSGITGSLLISALATACSSIVLMLMGNLYVESAGIFVWAIFYGIFYALALLACMLAVATGPLNIVSLISNMSLIVPVLFGLLFWGEKLSDPAWLGLAMVFAVLILGSGGKQAGSGNLSPKWKIYMPLAFLGNGAMSIYRYYFTQAYPDASSSSFMCWGLLFSALVLFLVLGVYRLRGGRLDTWLAKGRRLELAGVSLATGLGIAFGSVFMLMAIPLVPAAILYPVLQGGLIPLTWLICVPLYREKITRRSLLALVLGVAGIVLLNL